MTDEKSAGSTKRLHKPAEERRDEILTAAAAVFAQYGYRATDVQLVADRLGIGKGTVYRYFGTKEILFRETLKNSLDALQCRVQTAMRRDADPVERLRAGAFAYLHFFDEHPETVELFVQERAEFRDQGVPLYFIYSDAHRPVWIHLFEEIADSGRMAKSEVEAALDILGSLLHGMIAVNCPFSPRRSLAERFDQFFPIYLRGVLQRP